MLAGAEMDTKKPMRATWFATATSKYGWAGPGWWTAMMGEGSSNNNEPRQSAVEGVCRENLSGNLEKGGFCGR